MEQHSKGDMEEFEDHTMLHAMSLLGMHAV
jgi:hypothetical protein